MNVTVTKKNINSTINILQNQPAEATALGLRGMRSTRFRLGKIRPDCEVCPASRRCPPTLYGKRDGRRSPPYKNIHCPQELLRAKFWQSTEYLRVRQVLAQAVPDDTVTVESAKATEENTLTLTALGDGRPRTVWWCRDRQTMESFDANVVYAECIQYPLPPIHATGLANILRCGTPVILYGPFAMLIGNAMVMPDGPLPKWHCNTIHQFTRGDPKTELKDVTHLHYQWALVTPNRLSQMYTPFVSINTTWRYALFRAMQTPVVSQVVTPNESAGARNLGLSLYMAEVRPASEYMTIVGQMVLNMSGWDTRVLIETGTPDASFRQQMTDAVKRTEQQPLPLLKKELELWNAGQQITESILALARNQASAKFKEEQAKQKKLESALGKDKFKEQKKALEEVALTKGAAVATEMLKKSGDDYVKTLMETSIAPPGKRFLSQVDESSSSSSKTTVTPAKRAAQSDGGQPPPKKQIRRSGLSAPPAALQMGAALSGEPLEAEGVKVTRKKSSSSK